MRLSIDLVASVPKDPQRQDLNEDAYAVGESCVAVTDGASESYDSRAWARLLAEAYAKEQSVSAEWVAERIRTYLESTDIECLSWSRLAAFERGSFATLLGLELVPNRHEVDVLAIGDSLAVHVRDGAMLSSFPFAKPEDFDVRPRLLSTLASANTFIDEHEFFKNSSTTWEVQSGDCILLMTDAVGHWLLAHSEEVPTLIAMPSAEAFEELVIERRRDRRMRLDDSTVLRIVVVADEPGEAV